MVKRDTNIDILFRDGLKDMEVLPPSDIWEVISPRLNVNRSSGWVFRIAAGIAATISLGLLAYFIGINASTTLNQPLATITESDPLQIVPSGLQSTSQTQSPDVNEITSGINEPTIILADLNDNKIAVERPEQSFSQTDVIPVSSGPLVVNDRGNDYNLIENKQLPSRKGFDNYTSVLTDALSLAELQPDMDLSPSKWKIGATLSPTYLSSNLKTANQAMGDLRTDESAVLSYSGGVTVSYNMGGRLSLQTGLFYSSLGRQISGIDSYSGFSVFAGSKSGTIFGVQTTSGKINTSNKDIFLTDISADRISSLYSADNFDPVKAELSLFGTELRQNFEYLEIPLILKYKLIDRKIGFNIHGGMAYNFLLNNRTYALGQGEKVLIGSTDNMDKLLLSSALGMSMEYSLNEKISLNLEPSIRYYLNSGGRISSSNPYTFGIYSGFFYKF